MKAEGKSISDRIWFGYGLAIVAVAVAALVRLAFDPWVPGRGYFLFFGVAVLATGAFAGRGPALLSAVASIAAVRAFVRRQHQWHRFEVVI
ncbi:DUF4118 domain-containing protein [Sphingomonas koreensis]|uniref:DUF4118 domain-containing protein n=1 Tax=Sphingomonas koreensis TaxID=93064 RepID=UPI000F7E231F|nr:DUF4118 domain-containing protein [Sphingomonas koreensis]RSU73461.1 DUF4118 domain-containing protein [Sphingomonas koreensis]